MVDAHLAQLGSASKASELNGRYKALFSLSDDEDAALKRVSRACMNETDPVDKRAAEIIHTVKARYRPSGISVRAERVPPPPPELLALQNQKSAILGKHLKDLESSIGRGEFALLASRARRHVAAHSGQRSAK